MLSKPGEVLLRDDLRGFRLGCVEPVEDNPDEEVQEHKRDQKREAVGQRGTGHRSRGRGGGVQDLRTRKRSLKRQKLRGYNDAKSMQPSDVRADAHAARDSRYDKLIKYWGDDRFLCLLAVVRTSS